MKVQFGNLSVLGFEDRVGVDFSPEDMAWLNLHRTDKADFLNDYAFHIFDLPLGIVAGSAIGEELVARLRKYEFGKCHFYVETKESGF